LKEKISEDEISDLKSKYAEEYMKHPTLGYRLFDYEGCYFKIYKRTRLTEDSFEVSKDYKIQVS